MLLAELIGGPAHGETVEISSSTQVIDVDLGDGTFASYSVSAAGYWRYSSPKRVGERADRSAAITVTSSSYARPKA